MGICIDCLEHCDYVDEQEEENTFVGFEHLVQIEMAKLNHDLDLSDIAECTDMNIETVMEHYENDLSPIECAKALMSETTAQLSLFPNQN